MLNLVRSFPRRYYHFCVPKSRNKIKCENTRSIALLLTVNKILSVVICQRLVKKCGWLLGDYQGGFHRGQLTANHLFSVRQMVQKTYVKIIILIIVKINLCLSFQTLIWPLLNSDRRMMLFWTEESYWRH